RVYVVRNPLTLSRLLPLMLVGTFLLSCHRSPQPAKRFAFTGRVISIDTQAESALIDGDNIPGFMDAMAMSYKIKPAAALNQLAPGDSISAQVVLVAADPKNADAPPDYWLENVKVISHSKPATTSNTFH